MHVTDVLQEIHLETFYDTLTRRETLSVFGGVLIQPPASKKQKFETFGGVGGQLLFP